MPPKSKKISSISIIKFKRGKYTYVIPIEFEAEGAKTLENIKRLLIEAIVASGGLTLIEEDPLPEDEEDLDEDNIPVPKSEYIQDEEDIDNPNIISELAPIDIRLAVPKDKTNPYGNEWIELDDNKLANIDFNDYDILAFAYGTEESFEVIEAAYEE
ncbi:hypothetical protein G9P44_005695 [Scheffersomyces stipitis]|nr:hypothetical protein G9P44_005695 [Scheffersomyces stipitis]